jgi:hypothetical protein
LCRCWSPETATARSCFASANNTAIRDGFDLAWKLAWVVRGWGADHLLDSYESERRPVAEFNIERSGRTDGSILGNAFGLNADIGGRIAHVWVPRESGVVSTLDLLHGGSTLFVGPNWEDGVPVREAGAPPLTVERLDAIAALGLGLAPTAALLARPDGHVAALWNVEQPGAAPFTHAITAAGETAVPAQAAERLRWLTPRRGEATRGPLAGAKGTAFSDHGPLEAAAFSFVRGVELV